MATAQTLQLLLPTPDCKRSAEAGKAGLTHGDVLMLIHEDLNYE